MFSPQLKIDFPCEHLNQSFFSDLRLLKKCVSQIIEITESGQSSSTVYRIQTKDDRVFFMKLFITEVPDKIKSLKSFARTVEEIEGDTKEETSNNFIKSMMEKPKLKSFHMSNTNCDVLTRFVKHLIKEKMLYQECINKMTDYNICPFFVQMVGFEDNVHVNTISNFLKGRQEYENENPLSDTDIISRLMKNVTETLQSVNGRSFTENFNIISLDDLQKVRFGYMITNTLENGITLSRFIDKLVQTLRQNKLNFDQLLLLLLYICFQVLLATSILDCCKIIHGDLHFKNILVSANKSTLDKTSSHIVCKLNENVQMYELNHPLMIKIFDFDRSYIYNKNSSYCIGAHPNYCAKNTEQFKMLVDVFVRDFRTIPGAYGFNENEKAQFHQFVNDKIFQHFLKKTKFTAKSFYSDISPVDVNEKNTIDAFHHLDKNCRFETLSDETIKDNFNPIEYVIDKIYNDPDFIEFNQPRNQKVNTYYVAKDMFDDFGMFSFDKQNEFRTKTNQPSKKTKFIQ